MKDKFFRVLQFEYGTLILYDLGDKKHSVNERFHKYLVPLRYKNPFSLYSSDKGFVYSLKQSLG